MAIVSGPLNAFAGTVAGFGGGKGSALLGFAAVSAAGQLAQGFAQRQAANFNAAILTQRAAQDRLVAEADARLKRRQLSSLFASQRAGRAGSGNAVAFGDFGLQALGTCWMSARQIEAGRRAITRYVRRGGKLWIRVFPDKPVTKKPLEVRQGSGKGPVEFWVAVVKPGRVIYEIAGVREDTAREAMRLAAQKLPIRTRFVSREAVA